MQSTPVAASALARPAPAPLLSASRRSRRARRRRLRAHAGLSELESAADDAAAREGLVPGAPYPAYGAAMVQKGRDIDYA